MSKRRATTVMPGQPPATRTKLTESVVLLVPMVALQFGTEDTVVLICEDMAREDSPSLRLAIEVAYSAARDAAYAVALSRVLAKYNSQLWFPARWFSKCKALPPNLLPVDVTIATPVTIKLADDDHSAVKAYGAWLLTSTAPIKTGSHEDLVKMYLFGERNNITRFCHAVITRMLARVNRGSLPSLSTVNMLFDLPATSGSHLRTFIVDCYKAKGLTSLVADSDEVETPRPSFIKQVLALFAHERTDMTSFDIKRRKAWNVFFD